MSDQIIQRILKEAQAPDLLETLVERLQDTEDPSVGQRLKRQHGVAEEPLTTNLQSFSRHP